MDIDLKNLGNAKNTKKRVLVVDDNKDVCEFMKTAFSDEFEVDVSENAEGGLEKCAAWLPDLVLLDINLPGVNGIEFLRRMALNQEISKIPVIVITASDFNGITESLARRHHNVSAFMTKLSPVGTIREHMLKALRG